MSIDAGTRQLAGRVALVTGVSRRAGIGAAMARELADAGATLVVASFRAYDAQQAWGPGPDDPELRAIEVDLDLGEPEGPARLFDEAIRRHGRVDVRVNNAAHWAAGSIARVDVAQLDRHWAVNLRAAVLLCRDFVRHLPAGTPGRIVNVTSGQGRDPMPGEIAYAVTKAGLDVLTRTLAADLAPRAITVNAIDPGPTDTGWMTDAVRTALRAASPDGLLATAGDTAKLVRYLASDAAADITGQIVRTRPGWLD
jgi:3-oxoacyl-[acyl-carrier protein] reductase